MNRVPTWLIVLALLAGLYVAKDYLPKRKSPDVRAAERDIQYAKTQHAADDARIRALERELEHSHRTVVRDTVTLRPKVLAYTFGKDSLDLRDSIAVKKQLARADEVIELQKQTISDQADALETADQIIAEQKSLQAADSVHIAGLERLNAGIRAEIPTRVQQLKHDAAVAGITGATLMTLKLVFGK